MGFLWPLVGCALEPSRPVTQFPSYCLPWRSPSSPLHIGILERRYMFEFVRKGKNMIYDICCSSVAVSIAHTSSNRWVYVYTVIVEATKGAMAAEGTSEYLVRYGTKCFQITLVTLQSISVCEPAHVCNRVQLMQSMVIKSDVWK